MAYDSREIANLIIDWHWSNQKTITHLSLQKLIFLSHGHFLASNLEPLTLDPFEAWQYGPVLRVIYEEFDRFSDNPIRTKAKRFDFSTMSRITVDITVSDVDSKFIFSVLDTYARLSAFQLVSLTHTPDSAWSKVWNASSNAQANLGMHISNDLILESFSPVAGSAISFQH